MKLSDAVEGFFICKTGNHKDDLSPATIRLYQPFLSYFTQTAKILGIESITPRDLERFMVGLAKSEHGLSSYTQKNCYEAIRLFENWALDSVIVK